MTKAEKESRRDWVASLKPGDDVVACYTFRGKPKPNGRQWRATITSGMRLTWTGCQWNRVFNELGIVAAECDGPAIQISLATDELKREWLVADCTDKIRRAFTGWSKVTQLTDDQIVRMAEILDEPKAQ
jgi:hypothetical protein